MTSQLFVPPSEKLDELFRRNSAPGADLTGEWLWSPEFRSDSIPENSGCFQLTPKFNLDSLFGKTCLVNSEVTLYKTFEADAEKLCQFGVGCDWYFQAFCNGVLCCSTWELGNGDSRFSPEDHPFLVPVKHGTNLLVIRVRRGQSSWLFSCSGHLSRFLCKRPQLANGPFAGHPGNDFMSISFLTCGSVGSGVEYRIRGTEKWLRRWDSLHGRILRRRFHKIALRELSPGREYEYRVVMLDPDRPDQYRYSGIFFFRTPQKDQKKFHFLFTADLQTPDRNEQLKGLLKACDAPGCDFVVLGGDIGSAYHSSLLTDEVLPLIQNEAGSDKPVIYVRGNHETRGEESDAFPAFFGHPEGDATYWLFRYGDTAFLVLDCWEDKASDYPGAMYCKYNLDQEFQEEQCAFFRQATASDAWRSAARRIVLCHGAPFSHSAKYPQICDRLKQMTDAELKGENPRTLVNLWLTGHTHRFARSIPGSSEYTALQMLKKPLYDGRDYRYPVLTVAGPRTGHPITSSVFRVDAEEDESLTVTSFASDGRCLEKIRISKDNRITEELSLPHYQKHLE